MDDIKKGKASLSKYGLDAAAAQLDMTNEVGNCNCVCVFFFETRHLCAFWVQVDTKFLAELLLVKQMVEQVNVVVVVSYSVG